MFNKFTPASKLFPITTETSSSCASTLDQISNANETQWMNISQFIFREVGENSIQWEIRDKIFCVFLQTFFIPLSSSSRFSQSRYLIGCLEKDYVRRKERKRHEKKREVDEDSWEIARNFGSWLDFRLYLPSGENL